MLLSKNTLMLFTIGFLALVSCKKQTDGSTSSNDTKTTELPKEVTGTFTGDLSYTGDGDVIAVAEEGEATVTQKGSSASISFSDDVPSILDLQFELKNGSYSSVGSNGSVVGITITESALDLGVTNKEGEVWSFSGTK